ncbi:TetR/AcrR family transcriptional regulator [Desmospora activa]|uniref:TetR family transcriptional regulator n=1 Tax=Desmospora activa DSM 45169 TaxID=1121389 RepID=A0A2T4Z4J2_9BACL|nr:TetR/AcrR family transcriptional regulator [Desmospora activa]PTM56814.1 TetR family transcriptional regulator [Desmospora activa DSM 45169]
MNNKRTHILECAMKLFAEKGFHHTTIQEIADKSGVSKGSVYIYFRSKNDLILSIVEHNFSMIQEQMEAWNQTGLPAREKMMRKLNVYLGILQSRKEFFIMLIREQGMNLNQDLKRIFRDFQVQTHTWLGTSLEEIYGESIRPYRWDMTIIFEGMLHSLLRMWVFGRSEKDISVFSTYLLERLDDLAKGLLDRNATPLIDEKTYPHSFRDFCSNNGLPWKEVRQLLDQMETKINEEPSERLQEYLHTLEILRKELDKTEPDPLLFQGMLANLKGVKALDPIRQKVATLLNIQLI